MKLREIADKLGIGEYPEGLETAVSISICDEGLIKALEERFSMFRDFYDAVIEGAQALQKDPLRLAWGEAAAGYVKTASVEEARQVPLPMEAGQSDMLPLLIQLPLLLDAAENYRRRGFSEETVRELMGSYYFCMDVVRKRTGKIGLDLRYFRWQFLYTKSLIFRYHGFNIEVREAPQTAFILKNREDGRVVPLVHDMVLHKSGMVLGSAGCEDPEGARTAAVRVTEDGFYGYPAVNGLAAGPEGFFPRKQWECVLQPGNHVLAVHLPRGMDLSPDKVTEALDSVKAFVRQRYPEYDIRGFSCGSWLLDPALKQILGPDSRIVRFAERFARFPTQSAGQEVFFFVFPPNVEKLEDLPENTRLERELKKLYLNGGFIHAFYGVIV